MKKTKLRQLYEASIRTNNYGDISIIDPKILPDFDLFNFSFPCTDISVAGKQVGMKNKRMEITRSGLYIYGMNIVKTKRPKYIMIENVKNLISKKFINDFYSIINELENIGYDCYYPKNDKDKPMCLNAKNYGVPQNRERIYVICIREDIDNHTFQFPNGFDNGIRLKDLLEESVDEKYYISQDKTNKLLFELKAKEIGVNPCLTPDRLNKRQNGRRFKEDGEPSFTINTQDRNGILINHSKIQFKDDDISSCLDANYYKGLDNHAARTGVLETNNIDVIGKLDMKGQDNIRRVYNPKGISPTLSTMQGGQREPKILEEASDKKCIMVKEATTKGYAIAKEGDSINIQFPNSKTRRGRVGHGISQTLETSCNQGILTIDYRIRKLTPLECWRLMSFDDEDFYKVKDMCVSDSSLYKMAGNSIVVKVLEYIFKNLFKI